MNKFLLILLIVVSALTEVQNLVTGKLEDEPELFDKTLDWLRTNRYTSKLIDQIQKYGKPTGV